MATAPTATTHARPFIGPHARLRDRDGSENELFLPGMLAAAVNRGDDADNRLEFADASSKAWQGSAQLLRRDRREGKAIAESE